VGSRTGEAGGGEELARWLKAAGGCGVEMFPLFNHSTGSAASAPEV